MDYLSNKKEAAVRELNELKRYSSLSKINTESGQIRFLTCVGSSN